MMVRVANFNLKRNGLEAVAFFLWRFGKLEAVGGGVYFYGVTF